MTDSQLQDLLQAQGSGATAGSGDILGSLLEPLLPMLSLLLLISLLLTLVIIVFFIINVVQKQRQHAAIMRIDKNLQKLVDAKLVTPAPETLIDTPEEQVSPQESSSPTPES